MTRVYLIVTFVTLYLLFNELAYGKVVTDKNENILYNILKLVKPVDYNTKTIDLVDNNIEAKAIPESKCAEIGEFCMNNSDCCSNLCLGFLKRCVSSYRFFIIVMAPSKSARIIE